MEKKQIIELLNKLLITKGYKRKGNNWLNNNGFITKIINLQQSEYSKTFYLNYGYIIREIPLKTTLMHIQDRLQSSKKIGSFTIGELLDLENQISDEQRIKELTIAIKQNLIYNLECVNSENDILTYLKNRPQLNDVPLIVKKHFGLGY